MNVQVLFSAMFQEEFGLNEKGNVKDQYVVVNQTDFQKFPNLQKSEKSKVFISLEERGRFSRVNRGADGRY